MSIDTAYSTSDRNVGKVILYNGSAVSRTPIKTIGNIPINTTTIKIPVTHDKLTNSSMNMHSIDFLIPGRKGDLELAITQPPVTSKEYKDNTIFNISIPKDKKSKYTNYRNLTDEPYSSSLNVKYSRVGLPVNIFVFKGNSINYPNFSLKNYNKSKSIDSKILASAFSITNYFIKKNSICQNTPSIFFNINSDVSYSCGEISHNPLTLLSTTINVNKLKHSWTTSILKYDKCFITVFNKPRIELKIPHSNNPVIFDLQIPTDFSLSEPVKQREVDKVRYVVQKDSFVELYIKFTSNTVTNVIGLPDGMFFDNNYIKGSPTLAGKYNIKIMCYEQAIMEGIIEVPNVQRKF